MMGDAIAMSDGQHNYGAIALLRPTLCRVCTAVIGPSAQELPAAMTPGLELVMPPFSDATLSWQARPVQPCMHCGLVKGEM